MTFIVSNTIITFNHQRSTLSSHFSYLDAYCHQHYHHFQLSTINDQHYHHISLKLTLIFIKTIITFNHQRSTLSSHFSYLDTYCHQHYHHFQLSTINDQHYHHISLKLTLIVIKTIITFNHQRSTLSSHFSYFDTYCQQHFHHYQPKCDVLVSKIVGFKTFPFFG